MSRLSAPAPRRSDRILLGLLLLVLALATTLSPIRNYDYWWHLKTGAQILADGAVPRADPFSFTAPGAAWVDHEWLFQVLIYLMHISAGPAVLVLVKSALLCGLTVLAARHLAREGHGPAGAAVLLMPALVGGAFRFDVRPELATLIVVPLTLALAMRARRSGRVAPLAAIVGLTALGANLHVGVILIPALLALATAATACFAFLDARRAPPGGGRPDGGTRFVRRLLLTTFAAALAVGANPYGFRLYAVPFELRHLLAGLPWPNLEWVRPTVATLPLFFVAAAVSLLVLGLGWRHLDPLAAPALVVTLVLAAAHARNVGLFFLLLPWGLARPARALVDGIKKMPAYRRGTGEEKVRPGFIAAAVLLLSGVPLLLWATPQPSIGVGVARDNEPAGLVDFIEHERIGGRLYNDVRFGGYLVWRRFPGARVFVDGRNEIYGDLMHDIAASMSGPQEWSAFLDRHGIDAALLRYQPTLQKVIYTAPDGSRRTGERAFAATYFPSRDWAVVYWDDDGMVLLRRNAANQEAVARQEYRALHPEDWRFQWAGALIGQVPAGPILADLERKLREDPGCLRALDLQKRFAPFAAAAAQNQAPDGAH